MNLPPILPSPWLNALAGGNPFLSEGYGRCSLGIFELVDNGMQLPA
ncbi:hypothetical protein [Arthrobacter livingstonensis]|nr:hypothetical protein [Arthrobacter livingstonensis]